MSSTYSPSLKLTLIGDGDQAGIWGQTTNTNLGTLLEQAITGVQSIAMSDANYTLSNYNGVSDEARNAVLVVTGANNAVRDLIPPVVKKLYTIVNNTSGGYDIRVIGTSGTGVNIPNGSTCLVYCNGTNFYQAISSIPSSASNLAGGNAGYIPYQSAPDTTAFLAAGTTGQVLVSGGAGAPTWASGPPAASIVTSNFNVFQSGTNLIFQYNGATVFSVAGV